MFMYTKVRQDVNNVRIKNLRTETRHVGVRGFSISLGW